MHLIVLRAGIYMKRVYMKAIEIDSFKMICVPLGPRNWKISEIRDLVIPNSYGSQ